MNYLLLHKHVCFLYQLYDKHQPQLAITGMYTVHNSTKSLFDLAVFI